ncbi:hypothetical protein MKD41_00850 [Lutibacter sp. A64]|uniref:hypothetical protein n=1 Tax=Lutibacter sp. A64 TaxID=2918526 RepID=UPI001F05F660|nr:hypothetical protein [Lutibacter sp. A64]UMB54040.1 hypothetical protein MKD41_00850 [Lutibacter sp. A64]
MDVKSVICLENVCKVIPVRVYWNNLGQYLKYELNEGATLEKYEADLFEKEDYIKLHAILLNENSPFKSVQVDEILKVTDESHNEVDAVSGATALDLNEEDTVKGAALTCYTLWHWTHGDIQSIIRNITGLSCKSKDFKSFLKDDDVKLKLFSIEQLVATNFYKKDVTETVIKETIKNPTLTKASINYLENASKNIYLSASLRLIKKGTNLQKILVLNSLLNTKKEISKSYLDELSNEASGLNSFQEVSLFLKLMRIKNSNSKKVKQNVFPLLKQDFIIGRNVYWFLKEQKLNKDEIIILNEFQKQYKNEL